MICNDPLLPSTVRVLLCVSAVFCIIQALVIKLITFPKFIRLYLSLLSFIYFGLIPIDRDIFTANYTWVQSVSRQTGSLFIHVPPRFRVTYDRPWPSYIEFESRLLRKDINSVVIYSRKWLNPILPRTHPLERSFSIGIWWIHNKKSIYQLSICVEPRSPGGNTSSNPQISVLIPQHASKMMERMWQRHGSD